MHCDKSDKCDQTKKFNFWITAAYIPRKENLDADIPLFAILGEVPQKVMSYKRTGIVTVQILPIRPW